MIGEDLGGGSADLLLVVVDHSKIQVPISCAHGDLNLHTPDKHQHAELWTIYSTRGQRTAFPTSPGGAFHVPRPMAGNFCPVAKDHAVTSAIFFGLLVKFPWGS